MQDDFNHRSFGSGNLFSSNLNVQEYLNSLPMEVRQEVTTRQRRYNEDMNNNRYQETDIEP